jgi:translocation and assembly module TamB
LAKLITNTDKITAKSFLRKTGKVLLFTLNLVLLILIAAFVFLNTNYAKELIRNKLESYLQNKIRTNVEIGSIDYSFPQSIRITNFYIEDQQKDTLLYEKKLSVDLNMLKLITGEIYISKVELTNTRANILRAVNDSNYNFQFIINAFSGDKTASVTTDTSAMKITLKELVVKGFSLSYKDKYGGNDFTTTIKDLDISIDKFQPDRMQFAVNDLKTTGIDFSMVSYNPNPQSTISANDTAKNDLQFSVKKLDLNDINASMTNNINGMFYGNHFQHLIVNNTAINMALKKANFDTIILDSSFVKFISPKTQQNDLSKDTATTTIGVYWIVALKSLQMNNDQIQFDNNELPKQKEGLDPAHINAQSIKVNTGDILYSPDSITAIINQLAFHEKSGFTIDTTHARIFYNAKSFSAAELYLKTPRSLIQNSVKLGYDNISQLTTHPEKTSVQLKLSHTMIAINDVYALMPSVKKFMPVEKFHDNVINLNTEVSGTFKQLTIPFLQLNGFSGSNINAKAVLYNVTDSQRLAYDIYIFNSHILKSDIIKFMPANKNTDQLPAVLDLSTHIKGDLNNTVTDIQFNSTSLTFHGKANIKNIKNPDKLEYDLTINQGIVKKSFIIALLPPNTLPESIQLPDVISLTGTAKGDMNNIEPNLILGGSYGTISAKGYVHDFKDKEKAQYDLQLTANNFAAGKLLKQDSVLGNITMSATAKGRGFNYKTMHSSFSATIQNATIMNYPYKDINLDADLDGGQVSSKGSINVPDLHLEYNVAANVSGKYPSDVNATINLDTIQLQKLGFNKDTLNASFIATVKAADLNPKNLNASLIIDSTKLNISNRPYSLDTITATATTTDGNHTIILQSPFANVSAKGTFDYDKIGQSVIQYINKYYKITSAPAENIPTQEITFVGVIRNHPIFIGLAPTLSFDSINFKGSYTSSGGDSALNLHVTIPKLTYQPYIIDNGKVDVSSLNNAIDYAFTFNQLHLNKNIFYATSVKGNIANDSLNIVAVTKNEKNKDQFGIGAAITAKDKSYTISLKNDLLLNYQKWNVSPDNKISYSPQGILVKDF